MRKLIFALQVLHIVWVSVVAHVRAEDLSFPNDFLFGSASASYQIEGGWNAGGKTESIWDRMTHEHPEKIKDRSTGDIACDSYHKWKTDVKILTDLGVQFYRFSLSWPRLIADPFVKQINPDGVLYYNNLINELLKNDIEPMVTLYHWDLPQSLQDIGGWPNLSISDYFQEYADVAFSLFGDRVKTWITINEPLEVCLTGYGLGVDAPMIAKSGLLDYQCGKTLLLAHAKAYHLYNNTYRRQQKGKIGITINGRWSEPATDSLRDIEAAERNLQMEFGWWAHPIYSTTGNYPKDMIKRVAHMSFKCQHLNVSRLPELSAQEIRFLKNTSDFFGLNHYTTSLVNHVRGDNCSTVSFDNDKKVEMVQDPSWTPSAATWLKDVPWGFRKLLNWIKNKYNNPPVYVTENGFADVGELNDIGRIHYHQGYLKELLKAIHLDSCDVRAYTVWSVMDNMEWSDGYTLKFGLYYVNFTDPNRTRIPKSSVDFYKHVIRSRKVHNHQIIQLR